MQVSFDFAGKELEELVRETVIATINALPPALLTTAQPVYSHADVARMTGLTPHTVHEHRKEGRIEGSRAGKKYVYTREAILAYIAGQSQQRNRKR